MNDIDVVGYDEIIGEDEDEVGYDDEVEIVGAEEAVNNYLNAQKKEIMTRNAVGVRKKSGGKALRAILPMPQQLAVAPGATVNFRVTSTNPFLPKSLLIDPATAASFAITTISMNGQSMLENQNQVPAAIFSMPHMNDLTFLTVQPSSGIDMAVVNVGVAAADFRGAFIGLDLIPR